MLFLNRELSFEKGDTLYLKRDIDKNWFEGEHHGSVGIFPKAYIEVSEDTALYFVQYQIGKSLLT